MKPPLLFACLLPVAALAALAGLGLLTGSSGRTGGAAVTYEVRLLRGERANDSDGWGHPPVAGPAEETLRRALPSPTYHEIFRRQVTVLLGERAIVPLADGRTLRIDLSHPGKRQVTAWQDGVLLDSVLRPTGPGWTIIGGRDPRRETWFAAVARTDDSIP